VADYKELFMEHLDDNDVSYDDLDDGLIKIELGGDNAKSIDIIGMFEEDNEDVEFTCFSIGNFQNNYDAGIRVCNEMNKEYKWVKFYVDDDADIVAKISTTVDEYNCGDYCTTAVMRLMQIVDAAYPNFMRALWS
jgi:hypothetical protein